jgi:hypothetical protein
MKAHELRPVKEHEGLVECRVCRGWEGGLPTECPGHPISSDVQEAVYEGHIDYRNGGWCPKDVQGAVLHARMVLSAGRGTR